MADKERIGFIGLGNMGSRMARRIMAAGYVLAVYDVSAEKMRPFEREGSRAARTPKDAAGASDVVLCSVPDDSVLRGVVFGPDGAFAGHSRGSYFVNLSTVSPMVSRELAEKGRGRGVSMIDAAVSGSTPQAEQGSLVVFAGGDPAACEHVKPILDVLASNVFYMGPSGAGAAMKLVVNTLLGVGLQAIAEAVALGQKAGLPRERLLDVLGQTAVVAPGHRSKLANALREEYPVTFALRLMYKDFGLVLEEAAERAVSMPATAVARQMCAARMAKGHEEDYSAVIQLMENLAGVGDGQGRIRPQGGTRGAPQGAKRSKMPAP